MWEKGLCHSFFFFFTDKNRLDRFRSRLFAGLGFRLIRLWRREETSRCVMILVWVRGLCWAWGDGFNSLTTTPMRTDPGPLHSWGKLISACRERWIESYRFGFRNRFNYVQAPLCCCVAFSLSSWRAEGPKQQSLYFTVFSCSPS